MITVKKNKNHVNFFRFFMGLAVAVFVILASLFDGTDIIYIAVLGAFACVPLFVMLLYYEVWKVSFSKNKICVVSLFSKAKEYTYAQVKDAVQEYKYKQGICIRLTFNDGKRVEFQENDENAKKAITNIISHCLIRDER